MNDTFLIFNSSFLIPLKAFRRNAFLLLALLATACSKEADTAEPAADDVAAGGAFTVYNATSAAYGLPAPALTGAALQRHQVGDETFGQRFVTGEAPLGGGLGPLFINANCTACHVRDGRGTAPLDGADAVQMLFRLSQPGLTDQHGGPAPVPGFGDQLQNRAVFGTEAEGQLNIQYDEQVRELTGGETCRLRQPTYTVGSPYQPLPAGTLISPRVAPPVFGLGLLEAVADADVLALADEKDANGDGISGRPNYVWDVAFQQTRLGRFGWKANQPSLRQQNAAAYNGDMGITTSVFPLEPAAGQTQAGNQPPNSAGRPDVADADLATTTFYVQTLAVPARRNVKDAQVIVGKALFIQANCAACHVPRLRTSASPGSPAETASQTIFPFTDLLLHDMGPGLADNRPDFRATGQEWRTPPLWGLGLSETVNGHSTLLHDGRARTLIEAILWHGGEAAPSARAVQQMSPTDRAALLAFLKSL